MGKISEIFNFDNIGWKIKNLAKWSCWITILLIWIAAPIAFIVLVFDDWAELCWIPLVGAIVGPVLVWVESLVLYAFGEFVEDTHAMRKKYYPMAEEQANRKAEEKVKCDAEENSEKNNTTKTKEKTVVPMQTRKGKYECPRCGSSIKKGQEKCICFSELDWSQII